MTKSLADLVSELQEDVPAVSGVPSDAQYERAVKDAVADFSRRCGIVKIYELNVVSGTADYTLPDDFLSMVELDSLYDMEGGVMSVPGGGLIAFNVNEPLEETISIRNKTLNIYPTPAYTTTRYLEYKSAWVLVDDNYELTDDEAAIVLIKAKAICLDKLANASAGAGFRYTVGNMSVDKSGVADGYSKRQYELHGEFVKACEEYNGAVML